MKKRVFTELLIFALLIAAVSIFILSRPSYYSKETIGQFLLNSFYYSLTDQLALVQESLTQEKVFELNVPAYRQEYPVTCEVASLRMALGYFGVNLSEDDLIANLHFDTRAPMTEDRVWGDPELGFVGSVEGSIYHGTGYGVYDAPISELARSNRGTLKLKNPDIPGLTNAVRTGKPVIVWGLLSNKRHTNWETAEGKSITGYYGEHARVLVGYVGSEHDPKKLILLDPIYGRIRMDPDDFARDWQTMNNRHVVVY